MTIDEIKEAIRSQPDEEIEPLLEWLRRYYDGEVWDRQIVSDIDRVGPEAFIAILGRDKEEADYRRPAALRLLNSARFESSEERAGFLRDLEIVIGGSLETE